MKGFPTERMSGAGKSLFEEHLLRMRIQPSRGSRTTPSAPSAGPLCHPSLNQHYFVLIPSSNLYHIFGGCLRGKTVSQALLEHSPLELSMAESERCHELKTLNFIGSFTNQTISSPFGDDNLN